MNAVAQDTTWIDPSPLCWWYQRRNTAEAFYPPARRPGFETGGKIIFDGYNQLRRVQA